MARETLTCWSGRMDADRIQTTTGDAIYLMAGTAGRATCDGVDPAGFGRSPGLVQLRKRRVRARAWNRRRSS